MFKEMADQCNGSAGTEPHAHTAIADAAASANACKNVNEDATTNHTDLISQNGDTQSSLLEPKIIVDREVVSDAERSGCKEFFMGKTNKTPERYMKIRNYMIDMWNKTQPAYLTKIKARSGLKDCGDVNAIGRVHTFLEHMNIINAGAVAKRAPPKRTAPSKKSHYVSYASDSDSDPEAWGPENGRNGTRNHNHSHNHHRHSLSSENGRRRKVRDEGGNWVYEDEYYGGKVITHDVVVRKSDDADYKYSSSSDEEKLNSNGMHLTKRQRLITRKTKQSGSSTPTWAQNSEFRLIPCRSFDAAASTDTVESPSKSNAPFTVEITATALSLIDLHSHLMYTEIIGLLGGSFDEAKNILRVDIAFPCKSTSTTTECEMDPESEVEARRVFGIKDKQVVGWFHSHPTFEPTPSIRDIQNQLAYQTLCRRDSDSVEPFIGLIISPPGGHGLFGVSDINIFYIIDKKAAANRNPPLKLVDGDGEVIGPSIDGIPFRLPFTIHNRTDIPEDLIESMLALVRSHAFHIHRTDLSKRFRRKEPVTILEKLIISLRSYWHQDVLQEWDELVSDQLRPLLNDYFCKNNNNIF